jgi:hypothetical protein
MNNKIVYFWPAQQRRTNCCSGHLPRPPSCCFFPCCPLHMPRYLSALHHLRFGFVPLSPNPTPCLENVARPLVHRATVTPWRNWAPSRKPLQHCTPRQPLPHPPQVNGSSLSQVDLSSTSLHTTTLPLWRSPLLPPPAQLCESLVACSRLW